ncbi:MAG TPA: thioredoxin family protein [Acidimicrobiales bacterium]|nr:thioredoxin family protein [Acidimicrobiales bacterium]
MELPDGLVAVVKRDCPTCQTVVPVLERLASGAGSVPLTVYTQDDPAFPAGLSPVDDTDLDVSVALDLDTVPTLLRVAGGVEVGRTVGWSATRWAELTGVAEDALAGGLGLPAVRPGCGSRTLDPDVADEMLVRRRGGSLRSRRVELGGLEDEWEAMFDRGWSDGLPVVPPTPARVLRMLEGTSRSPGDVVAVVPPDLVECTVEKVAVNAVMAGCTPACLPVVLAAVAGACTDDFNAHGLLATTYASGPVLVVGGPVTVRAQMNSGGNVLGQGNRANSTIGRALQLVIRNVGGGRPGGVDRAAHGNPGKVGFSFAEDGATPWGWLHEERGLPAGSSGVTLFPGEGPRTVVDQLSRDPESLARSFAAALRSVAHPKLVLGFDALVVVGPEHGRVFDEAGWSRAAVTARLHELLQIPGAELVRGAGGISEGVPERLRDATLPKFRAGGLLLVRAGGGAGLFSAIIGGWANGATGSEPVSVEVAPWD